MRLERMGAPDVMYRAVRHARLAGQVPGRPVGEPGGWRLEGQGHDLRPLPRRDRRWPARARAVVQARHAVLREASPQPADLHHGIPDPFRDLHAGQPLSHQHHGPGAAAESRGGRWRSVQALKMVSIVFADHDRTNAIRHGSPPGEYPWPIFTCLTIRNTRFSRSLSRYLTKAHAPRSTTGRP